VAGRLALSQVVAAAGIMLTILPGFAYCSRPAS